MPCARSCHTSILISRIAVGLRLRIMAKLTIDQVQIMLADCPLWQLSSDRGGRLHRRFEFADFAQAFAFMSDMAAWSESVQHHPEWFNVYNKVVIDLTTHDVGGLSEKDIAWARQADRVARSLDPS